MSRSPLILGGFVLALGGAMSSLYTVDAREIAVVTSFGAPVKTVLEPGLSFKAPWPVHKVVRYDQRARVLAAEPTELLTADKKNLVVEPYAVWRIADPQRFLEAVGSVEAAELRISDICNSRIASSLGQVQFSDLLSVEATGAQFLPESVKGDVARSAEELLGVKIIDVRLRSVGLPIQNEQSIYERMRAERSRTANQYRSEGEEKAMGIRAKADRQAAEILADAEEKAAVIEAKADEDAGLMYAKTYSVDPDLYEYVRALEASERVFDHGGTVVLDSEASPFDTLLETP